MVGMGWGLVLALSLGFACFDECQSYVYVWGGRWGFLFGLGGRADGWLGKEGKGADSLPVVPP